MIHRNILTQSYIQNAVNALYTSSPIQYLVLEDFIESSIFESIEKELLWLSPIYLQKHQDAEHRLNHSVYLPGQHLMRLFDFFNSDRIDSFLSLVLRKPVKQEFYVQVPEVESVIWKPFLWCISQMYHKWDFFDWHIDGPIEEGSLWAFTYYLWWYSGEWKESYGWNLELGLQKNGSTSIETYHTIQYKKNTLVILLASLEAHHRVSQLQKDIPRYSIQSTIFKK